VLGLEERKENHKSPAANGGDKLSGAEQRSDHGSDSRPGGERRGERRRAECEECEEKKKLTNYLQRRVTSWDLRDQNPVAVRDLSPNLDDEATTIAISHDGKLLATAGSAQLVKLWSVKSFDLLAVGEGHSGLVNDLKFSPDDRQIVSVGEDGGVFIFNVYV